jgi:hypothetical protein
MDRSDRRTIVKRIREPLGVLTVALAALLAVALAGAPASAQITFGALSNFDVFNDTGQDCHGFEIELRDISSDDVYYTFGAPYERYGDPRIVPFTDASGSGVYVRYESPYDPAAGRFTQRTAPAPSPVTATDGHSCFNGGSITNYDTSGCEHFGVSLGRNPTRTVYRWLVADPNAPGALQPSGTKVSIPAPIWNVVPPAVPGDPPVVQAVIEAEPPQEGFEFGEALWVKVFKTEAPEPVELEDLVTDNPVVPQEPAEVEIEWVLLQANVDGDLNSDLVQEAAVGEGNESVTRRYEFYRYTGAYDPETNEARCDNPLEPRQQVPERCGAPDENGVAGVGEYVGAQMAALNLDQPAPSVRLSVSLAGAGGGAVASDVGGIDCGAACSASVPSGTLVTLAATPAAGSFFTGWSGGCSGTAPCAVTLTAATSVTASFEPLAQAADLSVSAVKISPGASAGRRVRYRVKVGNLGPAPAEGIVLTVNIGGLPAGDAASIRAPAGCTVAGTTITCARARLKANRRALTVVSVLPSAPATVSVAAGVTAATPDPAGGNNAASVTTEIQ